nr:hypothetical protein [Tanacetum cinerariifolium]
MSTRSSSSNLVGESSPNPTSSNPKCHNRRRSKQPFILEESPIDTMADQRTMAELLRAPTEGYVEAIVVPPILAEHFELKHSLINMMTSDQLFRHEKDNPRDHILRFNKITSTVKYKDVPNSEIKLMLFPFSLTGAAHRWLEKNPLVPFSLGKILFPNSSMNSFLSQERQILEMKFPTFKNGLMNRFMRHGIATKISFCLAADGNTFPEFRDNIQGYVLAAAVNYYQGNFGYCPLSVANQTGNNFNQDSSYQAPIQQNQVVPLSELEKIKKMNEINIKAMQTQINNVKNKLRNEMKTSIQASMSNQTNELKNMMASFFQMSTVSTLGSRPLPNNTIANPKGKMKAITTRSGLVLDGPSVPMPPPFINPAEDERVEETLTDPDLAEYTIKVPHPLVQKAKPLSQRNYVKMLKALLSNKEKVLELANTPLNENCSAVILKKLPEKLRDPRKFLIPCGFSKLKCKALTNLGSSINLMPLLVWKKLGLPELISTRMTLELANQAICTPTGIAIDVFVSVGKFTFPADFVIFDYESDPRVPLILGRPFLRTARALIDVHGEDMILRDGDERLTLNMRHDTSSYSNQPQKESINMINIYNDSYEDYLKDLFATNHLSGNPTFSSHPGLTSLKVINPLSGNPTFSSIDQLLEKFGDELALITFPLGNDDLPFDIEFDLKKLEYLLNHDPIKEMDSILEDSIDKDNLAYHNNNLFDTIPEMFTDEHTLDYSSPPGSLQLWYQSRRFRPVGSKDLTCEDWVDQMVNTRTDADLSAAVQNALQTLLPQIRADIREEFRTSSGPSDSGENPPSMVNTRTDPELSAAVQNALQTLLPQIRAEIREEFRTSSGPSNSGGNPPPRFLRLAGFLGAADGTAEEQAKKF